MDAYVSIFRIRKLCFGFIVNDKSMFICIFCLIGIYMGLIYFVF